MSNSYRTLSLVRMRNAMLSAGQLSATAPQPVLVPEQYADSALSFAEQIRRRDEDWHEERKLREYADSFALSMRWRVTIQMSEDKKLWCAYWCGSYSAVLHRAHLLFRNPSYVSLEPAGIGGEISPAWLPLITTRS